jgi:molybdate transport system substrate-binding protein
MRIARLVALGLLCLLPLAAHAVEITVSAAASLAAAIREIAMHFEAANPGVRVRLNVGASGALLAQIARGAPVDVFISADQESMDQAQARGLVRQAQRRDVVSNTLVLVVPGSTGRSPATLADLAALHVARIAIGQPASVPAGRYAREALEAAGLWRAIEPRMIAAGNVRQALDYVARGEVDAGFVYATDAALMPDRVRVAFRVATTRPILYPAAPMVGAPAPAEAARFVEFLSTRTARSVFAGHGFGNP